MVEEMNREHPLADLIRPNWPIFFVALMKQMGRRQIIITEEEITGLAGKDFMAIRLSTNGLQIDLVEEQMADLMVAQVNGPMQ